MLWTVVSQCLLHFNAFLPRQHDTEETARGLQAHKSWPTTQCSYFLTSLSLGARVWEMPTVTLSSQIWLWTRTQVPCPGRPSCSIKLVYTRQTTAARREDCTMLRLIAISKKYSYRRNYEQGRVSLESKKVRSVVVRRAPHAALIYDYWELQRKGNPVQS